MNHSFFTLLLTVFLGCSPAAIALMIPQEYEGGRTTCATNKDNRLSEYEVWLQVPMDYQKPQMGMTDLYAWTTKPLNPKLPTVIFVSGGPGDTAHNSSLELPDWNVVFFDQRGISCSRPPDKETYLDRGFYSSENTARDIEEIRRHLGIDQISVYGVSYGTVPAHLYGHFFPQTTRAVVLEGVIFEGGAPLMEPTRRVRLLQHFFDSLPVNMQERILTLSQNPELAPNWFSKVGRMMLYLDNSPVPFRTFLDGIIWDDATVISMMRSFESTEPEDSAYGFGHVMMGMIGCQELGMNLSGVSFTSVFKNRHLVSDEKNESQNHYCASLGFSNQETDKIYKATQYKTTAPTTYIQGTFDGATSAPNAIKHFKQAALGFAQLVLVRDGGHAPLHGTLSSGFESGAPVDSRASALKTALQGEALSSAELQAMNQATAMKWLQVLKK